VAWDHEKDVSVRRKTEDMEMILRIIIKAATLAYSFAESITETNVAALFWKRAGHEMGD
jgi:hypothetical protein